MKEAGSVLHMTTRTVAYHKYRIMEVLGARSTAELVKYAVRNHYAPLGRENVREEPVPSTGVAGLRLENYEDCGAEIGEKFH